MFRPIIEGIDRVIREVARLSNVAEAIGAGKGLKDIYAASALPEAGSSGFKVNSTPLKNVPVTQPEFKLPEFTPIDVNDFLKPIHDEMQAREDAFAARRKPSVSTGQAGEGGPGGPTPQGVPGPPAAGKGAGGVMDLVAYFNKLQSGAVASKDPAERSAKANERAAGHLGTLVEIAKGPKAKAIPAVSGPA